MNLEVGMYVRTTKGKIDKIDDYSSTFDCYHLSTEPKCYGIEEDDITKASHNIIDLIEVGDYVNGYRVDFIENIDSPILKIQKVFCEEYEKDLYSKSFNVKNIKSIVTKEQFESMSYKVGD